jgi:hypothetical protein
VLGDRLFNAWLSGFVSPWSVRTAASARPVPSTAVLPDADVS